MPTFAYSGRTRGGQSVAGERSADTMDAAVTALRRDQITVTKITPAREAAAVGKKAVGKTGKKASAKSLAVFTRQSLPRSTALRATRPIPRFSPASLVIALQRHTALHEIPVPIACVGTPVALYSPQIGCATSTHLPGCT